MISKVDVVVIGSGWLGAATAYYLTQYGRFGVALIDKHDIGSQTSPRAAGMVSCLRNILQIDYPTLNQLFLNGSTAMVIQWDDLPLKVENPTMSKVVGKGGFAPCPVRSYMAYSRVMAVSAFSKHPAKAYKLMSYMQQPDVGITYVYGRSAAKTRIANRISIPRR